MAARQGLFQNPADLALERLQLRRQVQLQVEAAVIHALDADGDIGLRMGLSHPGEAGHAAHAH